MKKYPIIVFVILLTGCSFVQSFFYMDETAYYNVHIGHFNVLSGDLDNLMKDYYYYIPEEVSADSEIIFKGSYYTTVKKHFHDAEDEISSVGMTIEDSSKEDSLESVAGRYFEAFAEFLLKYKYAIDYYSDGDYLEDPDYSEVLDAEIINDYNAVSVVQLELSEMLTEYMGSATSVLDENSINPPVKLGAAITLLTGHSEGIVDYLYAWEAGEAYASGVEALYDDLVVKHALQDIEASALYHPDFADLFHEFDLYLEALSVFENEVGMFMIDAQVGITSSKDTSDYESLFVSYDAVVEAHNGLADALAEG
ncbi:MAG: hypothetical protein ABII07_06115 [Patescibacteria group bacterium]|nr:YiiG family protein [Patescibacteria group bacterium]